MNIVVHYDGEFAGADDKTLQGAIRKALKKLPPIQDKDDLGIQGSKNDDEGKWALSVPGGFGLHGEWIKERVLVEQGFSLGTGETLMEDEIQRIREAVHLTMVKWSQNPYQPVDTILIEESLPVDTSELQLAAFMSGVSFVFGVGLEMSRLDMGFNPN